MKLNSFGMKSHPKRYEKIPMIPRYETDAQGMKDSTRYEKCAQGIQQIHKGMNMRLKV
jgi:hypothetical protein